MSEYCITCSTNKTGQFKSHSRLKANAQISHGPSAASKIVASINPVNSILSFVNAKMSSASLLKLNASLRHGPFIAQEKLQSEIDCRIQSVNNVRCKFDTQSIIPDIKTDKFGGHTDTIKNKIINFNEKLYPINDLVTNYNDNYFVNESLSSSGLFESINFGVASNGYVYSGLNSKIISDEDSSYIQPSSIYTSGIFRYKCEVNAPLVTPKESFLFIRAAAPVSTTSSDIPPEYKIFNIRFEDPSGNLIIKYKDITLRGDADYSKNKLNFVTYITEPEINNLSLFSWQEGYPILGAASGYTLNFDFNIQCLDDPFSEGFNKGYEDTCKTEILNSDPDSYLALDGAPLSTQSQVFSLNPTNSLRISDIEIANSGSLGFTTNNVLTFYTEVNTIGNRLVRSIIPVDVCLNFENLDIYPVSYSTWVSSPDAFDNIYDNSSKAGAKLLANYLADDGSFSFITLSSSDPHQDSGRLTLKFSHQELQSIASYSDGEFSFGDVSFDAARFSLVPQVDHFFAVEDIELKIVAKKAIGSRNYALDIVGYSDDGLLNVTPKVGAFLQNSEQGSGTIPSVSGFYGIDDLAIAGESFSEKEQHYISPLVDIPAGDHYKLSSSPVVNSTTFAEYTIPLTIYKNEVRLGLAPDYSSSSYFENLYFDIYPIPSGASIASAKLVVKYRPSNALTIHTVAHANDNESITREMKLFPAAPKNTNDLLDLVGISGRYSLINNIPHGFGYDATLKTNYSRRWRGVDGNVVDGPFNQNQFKFFEYQNDQRLNPFLNGFFTFNRDSGNVILSDNIGSGIPISGNLVGQYNKVSNIGLRFNSNSLFSYATNYKTIDWTTPSHELYGKILDSYDNAIRLSGVNSYINFGNQDITNGFSVYVRFSPDLSISGVNYNCFDSGVLVSKWDNTKNLEFALFYQDGHLSASALDSSGNIVFLQDPAHYTAYQYPLSVLLTYNDNLSNKLRLYTSNEVNYLSNDLRDESDEFIINSGDSKLLVSYCESSGIGTNIFVTELGISTYNDFGTNITLDSSNKLYKQTTAESWLKSNSHTLENNVLNNKFALWDKVDGDTSKWHLGEFKSCVFSPDFDFFKKREGQEFIYHHIKNDGVPYVNKTNIPLPSNVYADELSYHTQIENDFLRFNIADIEDNDDTFRFYSATPRITKNIPRGYSVADKAFVIDAIIEHKTNNTILWNDGKIGPKLILSLYTKNKEDISKNAGLINRSIHYLQPSGCIHKIYGSFTFDSMFNTSEPWANFDLETRYTEFGHKYFSDDLDSAFIQIDLVYPSGNPYNSLLKIHSLNIRLEDAILNKANKNNSINLYSSGEPISLNTIDLYSRGLDVIYNNADLFVLADYPPVASSILNMHTFVDWTNESLNLFVKNSGLTDVSLPIYVDGRFNQFNEQVLPLVQVSNIFDHLMLDFVGLYTSAIVGFPQSSGTFALYARSIPVRDINRSSELSLHLSTVDKILQSDSESMALYSNTEDPRVFETGQFNLYTVNYPAFGESFGQYGYITWNGDYTGKNIDVDDNIYASLAANDEIRGVDLICYGRCDTNGACSEITVDLHDSSWSPPSCVNGGIIRPENVYTNLDTSGFNTPIGYSGNFYGIRKFDGLIPNAQYSINVSARTGNNKSIVLPRIIEEVEYGLFDDATYSGVKITTNNDRQPNDYFGKSIAVTKDILAVGAPLHDIDYSYYDSSGNLVVDQLTDAGAIFVYNRNVEPSGSDWTYSKGDWVFDSKIMLPSSIILEHYNTRPKNIGPFTINERLWQTGQRGRKLGYSIDLASLSGLNNRSILVAGGPGASWSSPEYVTSEVQPSSVSVGLLIFSDEFEPEYRYEGAPKTNFKFTKSAQNIFDAIKDKDILFKYFSSPSVKFDVQIMICEPLSSFTKKNIYSDGNIYPNVYKKTISRNQGLLDNSNQALEQIKEVFHLAYPYDSGKLNNNIPVMLGVIIDDSRSLGRQAISPALDQFINYYKSYSLLSGVKDFYGQPSQGAVYETVSSDEVWVDQGISLINSLFDTNRLITDNQFKLFSSGIGAEFFNTNLSEFNYVPESGGRVYIFEKEHASWNLIQEIRSPNTYDNDVCDRYGHSVSISKNAEVIVVGSPYINEACQVYEYKPSEKTRLLSNLINWVKYKNASLGGASVRYTSLIINYETWLASIGVQQTNSLLYNNLNGNERFEARKYFNISEYQKIFTYSYNDIPINGENFLFIPEFFAPSSRIGYSTAVNEDGSIIAFGAPTDSMNRWEDGNIYYKNRGYQTVGIEDSENLNSNSQLIPAWASNVNAGAVRIFESRKIYPHNRVVEFNKFGNLHRSLNDPLDSGHFNYISSVFSDLNFTTTEFTDVDIPQDVGLAFIITPEIDALSDEVADNILNWLSLGDRNLVLVGNDPVWENDGIYQQSNEIINKILSRLSSRIRLSQARNAREALVDSSGSAVPSFIPANTTVSYTKPQNLSSYGVADIRFHFPGFPTIESSSCDEPLPGEANEFNPECSLPLGHNGDLRAEWKEKCLNCKAETISYPVNLAYMFKTFTPTDCCNPDGYALKEFRKDLPKQEPIPLLVAATLNTYEKIIPATPDVSGLKEIKQTIIIRSGEDQIFDENNIVSGISLLFNADTKNSNNFILNIGSGSWYEPINFTDRQSIVQSQAYSTETSGITKQEIQNITLYAAEDKYENNSSIFVVAGTFTEDQDLLYKYNKNFFPLLEGYDDSDTRELISKSNTNPDNNINFYTNLVYNRFGSNIAQLGGWTGRDSFTSAYSRSALQEVFLNNGNNVELNVSSINVTHDVCWIANPLSIPSDGEISELQNWLSLGNRKLIITMGDTNEISSANTESERNALLARLTNQANIVKTILTKLGSKIKPLFLDIDDRYDFVEIPTTEFQSISLNASHPISKGQNIKTSISSFNLDPIWLNRKTFIGLSSQNTVPVAFLNRGPVDSKIENFTTTNWKFDTGISKISLPVLAGSGYKLHITTVSETPFENQSINIIGTNFSTTGIVPSYMDGFRIGSRLQLYNQTIENITYNNSLVPGTVGVPKTTSLNIHVPNSVNNIDFYLYNSEELGLNNINYIPRTTRLLAISGELIPIIIASKAETREVIKYEPFLISSGSPSYKITTTEYGPIVSDATKYSCCLEGSIPDGPVIAAQEVEHFSPFLYGIQRSRITVLADSSLVQGRYAGDEFRRASSNTVNFIRSLYPFTDFKNANSGRQFSVSTKLVAPDRGSPAKYKSIVNNSGLNSRFGSSNSFLAKTSFSDKDSRYDPQFVRRPIYEPWIDPLFPDKPISNEQKQAKIQEERSIFAGLSEIYGSTSMFSGVLNNKIYTDVNYRGGIPQIMKDTGYDYLDFDAYPSGYPGDLFGYSIALSKDKLIIGAPFNAFVDENIPNWNYYINSNGSGVELSYNGGAGAVYLFEKTYRGSGISGTVDDWECTQKLRPATINVSSSGINDQFGYDVAIDSDSILIGAPGHSYGNHVVNGSGDFVRKFFNSEFNLPERIVTDLDNSGSFVLNNGAAFVYENRIQDWASKKLKFSLVEKVVPQDNESHIGSGDYFAESVSIYRSKRTDSDYTIGIGSSKHDYDTSGNNYVNNAGSAYVYDIMLREQPPSTPNQDAYLFGSVFGDTDENNQPRVNVIVVNSGESILYNVSGTVYTNNQGEIFVEISGQDTSRYGFAQQRPFIESVDGQIVYGINNSGNIPLFIEGQRFVSSNMNIFANVENIGNVYNNIGLYSQGIVDFATSSLSGLSLYSHAPDPISISNSGLSLMISGVVINEKNIDLFIRGR